MTDDVAGALPQSDRSARGVVTPEGVVVFVRLATLGERLTALVLDLVILLAAFVAVVVAMAISGGHLGIALGIVLLFLLRAFYFTGGELIWNGQTPGGRMSGLRVVNRYGGPLTPAAVIGRNLMREVELFLPLSLAIAGPAIAPGPWTYVAAVVWVGVLAALPIFNRDRLRAGDMVAGTWVVAEPKPVLLPDLAVTASAPASPAGEAYRFTAPQLVVYGVKELQVLEEVLRSAGKESGDLQRDVARRIARKIGYTLPEGGAFNPTAFLEAFYAAQRGRLEAELAFGRRRRDKHDRR
jgi:uncharacterized RDD family membrane protein YckC